MTLYEISNEYRAFLEAVENGEIPEEAIVDTLESITAALDEKADNIACIIKNLTAEKEAIKIEEDNLAARRKSKENEIARLKQYLSDMLLQSGYTKIETARNKISFRKSEKVAIDDEAAFIKWAAANNDEYLTYKEPTINRIAIKNALYNDIEVVGAHIESNTNIQIK